MPKVVIHMLFGHPAYWCPVCKWPHHLDARWKWNGSVEKPTFSSAKPEQAFSYLSFHDVQDHTYYVLERPGKVGEDRFATAETAENARLEAKLGPEWKVAPRRQGAKRVVHCHVYIKDGMCQVIGDTPGPLAGKTVPLEEWDPEKWQ